MDTDEKQEIRRLKVEGRKEAEVRNSNLTEPELKLVNTAECKETEKAFFKIPRIPCIQQFKN